MTSIRCDETNWCIVSGDDADGRPGRTEPVSTDLRLRDAALVCIGRFGLAKTTVDDIAHEAGCSRATLYRYFDGKPAIVRAAVTAEFERSPAR